MKKNYDLLSIARKAMAAKGLRSDYSPQALKQLARITTPAIYDPSRGKDLRHFLWVSIDNDDSLDLDQLTYAEEGRIFIAVADVDALIKKGTPIDEDAQYNTTSVYTPAHIFSMLPTQLSTNLTSLNENQDRLAIVIEIGIKPNGEAGSSQVYPAWVHNRAKLAYNQVAAWLEKPQSGRKDVMAQLQLQDSLAQSMKRYRHAQGALSLQTIEAAPLVENGQVVDMREVVKNRAMELIEDFMIAANGATTRYLEANGCPTLRRVVKTPEKWDRIVALAHSLGGTLPREPDVKSLEAFLTRQKKEDPLRFPDLSLAVIKLLGRGEYVAHTAGRAPPGHFGLAVKDYSHSTAPNRRYPDLITQRLLKAAFTHASCPYSAEELVYLAAHCTAQENAAEKVERQVKKSAAAILLSSQLGKVFDAIVTGSSVKGTWVRIFHPPVEGKLIKGFEGREIGDRLRVKLMKVDVSNGFIDFITATE